jgi:flavin-dependent dehydrogenase
MKMTGERDAEGRRTHGYTLRRERLDPILRAHAESTTGVNLRLGWSVKDLVRDGERVTGVLLERPGQTLRVMARLVVGADGRETRVGELAAIPVEVRPHTRAGFFAYYDGVSTRTGSDSQFWILGEDVAYSFPSDAGLVCLAVIVHESKLAEFRANRDGYLRAFLEKLPDGPDLSRATRVGAFIGVANTPNTYRWPVLPGLALIGDAAMASEYIWGVGCGWALESAALLVDHVAPALASRISTTPGLRRYAVQHRRRLYGRHLENTAFSASDKLPFLTGALLEAAPHDARLCELIALATAGRISRRDLRIPLRLVYCQVAGRLRRVADRVLGTHARHRVSS